MVANDFIDYILHRYWIIILIVDSNKVLRYSIKYALFYFNKTRYFLAVYQIYAESMNKRYIKNYKYVRKCMYSAEI